MPGTAYRLAIVGRRPPSGPASASLPLGIASILVSFVVICFAAVGAQDGWAGVAGAFALLAGLPASRRSALGTVGLRQVRRATAVTGRGVAIAGIVCGISASSSPCWLVLGAGRRRPERTRVGRGRERATGGRQYRGSAAGVR